MTLYNVCLFLVVVIFLTCFEFCIIFTKIDFACQTFFLSNEIIFSVLNASPFKIINRFRINRFSIQPKEVEANLLLLSTRVTVSKEN